VREAAGKTRRGELKLLELEKPYIVDLVFRESLIADAVEVLDFIERVNAYTVRFKADSARKILGVIEVMALVGSAVLNMATNIK